MSGIHNIRIENLVLEIAQITRDFEAKFGNLTPDQINFKPSSDTWSIAQNIDHLIAVNRSYYPIITDLQTGEYKPPFHARFDFLVNMFGRMILKSVETTRKKKIKTFPVWEPTLSDFGPALLDDFKRHQNQLSNLISESTDLLNANKVISSPANKNLVYSLETAFNIIITHEKRHFAQAKEMLEAQGL